MLFQKNQTMAKPLRSWATLPKRSKLLMMMILLSLVVGNVYQVTQLAPPQSQHQRQKSQGTPAFAQSHKISIGSLDDSIIFADFTKIELFIT